MTHPPAAVVRQLLIDESLFESDLGEDWAIFVSSLPAEPRRAACVYDSTPVADGRLMATGELVMHYGIQLRVRSPSYDEGRLHAQLAVDALAAVAQQAVTVSGTVYTVAAVSLASGVFPAGYDDADSGGRRMNWTANFLVTLSEDES